MGAQLNRRAILAVAAVLPAVAAGPSVAFPASATASGEVSRFRAWERETIDLEAQCNRPDAEEHEVVCLADRRLDVMALIATTPATQRASFAVKARMAMRDRLEDLDAQGAALMEEFARYFEAT